MRRAYLTDLTDAHWQLILKLIPPAKHGGRPRAKTTDMREIVNAILYLNRGGVQWRLLPHDFPNKSTVYYYFSRWRDDGTWDRILQVLREQERVAEGKQPTPSMVLLDSQSVKGTETGGEHGIDAHKKINGRKRHVLTDTLGLLVAVLVTSAAVPDAEAAKLLLAKLRKEEFPRVRKCLADQAYTKYDLPAWVAEHGYYRLEVTGKPTTGKGFQVIKWRWVVERTHAWLGRYRRHSRDYERRTDSSEAMLKISMIHRLLHRLKKSTHKDSPFRYAKKHVKS